MAKSLFLVASLLLLVPLSLAAGEPRKPSASEFEKLTLGGYNPIRNITDPYIQTLGKLAVEAHNKKAGTHLKFQEVYDGKYQIVKGTNYDLKLRALDGYISRTYGTLFYIDFELKDFYGISRN